MGASRSEVTLGRGWRPYRLQTPGIDSLAERQTWHVRAKLSAHVCDVADADALQALRKGQRIGSTKASVGERVGCGLLVGRHDTTSSDFRIFPVAAGSRAPSSTRRHTRTIRRARKQSGRCSIHWQSRRCGTRRASEIRRDKFLVSFLLFQYSYGISLSRSL